MDWIIGQSSDRGVGQRENEERYTHSSMRGQAIDKYWKRRETRGVPILMETK